jgi:hypothetical protein
VGDLETSTTRKPATTMAVEAYKEDILNEILKLEIQGI